jgi:hypothetical protein
MAAQILLAGGDPLQWLNTDDAVEANIMYLVAVKALKMQDEILFENLARRIASAVARSFRR